jgi:hypothetical protein
MAARPTHSQEAREGNLGASPRWARIVNQSRNRSPLVRHKDGERLVRLGRAEWVAADQLRLTANAANRTAATEAAIGYDNAAAQMVRSEKELRHVPMVGPLVRKIASELCLI